MRVIVIIDKYLNELEFRNYSSYWLSKLGFNNIKIEDERLSDDDLINNNDIIATKGDRKYTIQTFLNKCISEKEVNETIEDMIEEHVDNGVIMTNRDVSNKFRKYAESKSIEIIERKDFTEELNC